MENRFLVVGDYGNNFITILDGYKHRHLAASAINWQTQGGYTTTKWYICQPMQQIAWVLSEEGRPMRILRGARTVEAHREMLAELWPNFEPTYREDYMCGAVPHELYYGEIATVTGVHLPDFLMDRLRLARGDTSAVPLEAWDRVAERSRRVIEWALKERHDSYSLGTAVCVLKEAAGRFL